MRRFVGAVLLVCALCVVVPAHAGVAAGDTFYVNNVTGSDKCDGKSPRRRGSTGPFATIMRAVQQCTVGAVIDIANTGVDYREDVHIEGYRKGRAERPLQIDGHGATVNGLLEAPAKGWEHVKDDLYRFTNRNADGTPAMMPNSNWLGHWRHQGWFTEPQAPEIFFLNGKPAPQTLTLETIPPGGVFYDTQANPRSFYFRLPANKTLEDCHIEFPINTGVYVSDDYVLVRNLASKYSADDGFSGFWGQGVTFQNINGSFNCDQGFSMHGTSTTLVDGGLFERNGGCGICDVMSSVSVFRNVVVRDNMIAGAMLMGLAHSMLGCRITGNYGTQVTVSDGTSVNLVNCLIDGAGPSPAAGVSLETGRLDHCTIVNCTTGLGAGKSVSLRNSILTHCDNLIVAGKDAVPQLTVAYTLLGPGKLNLGGATIETSGWADVAKNYPRFTSLWIDNFTLPAPLYLLPKESPHYKTAEYGLVLGAVLKAYTGWEGEKPNDDPVPHP